MKRQHRKQRACQNAEPRRGSTLIIVLALLGLLTLLGLVFFTFANTEHSSAEFFTEAAKDNPDEVDNGMDYGMRTLMVGPLATRRNSVLWGRAGIMTNLTGGNDSRPNSGTGINFMYWDDPSTTTVTERIPVLDQNRDGVPDPLQPDPRRNLINFVDSQSVFRGRARNLAQVPAPDHGTTYPDANSLFLSWKGYAMRKVGGSVVQMVPVIIPSFMRPAMFRQGAEPQVTATNWFNDPGTDGVPGTDDDPYQGISFRPHPSHVYVNAKGEIFDDGSGQPIRRFLDPNNPADAALIAGLPGGSGGFPFTPPDRVTGVPLHDGKSGELGIFTATVAEMNNPNFDPEVYELDVDTDGDGIPDAIWMDFDYPVLEDPATGAKYTYMYAVSVVDMDGLVNLNSNGNLTGDLTTWAPMGGVDPDLGRIGSLSRSNAGLTPSEVNPIWALMRDPSIGGPGAFDQHQRFFGHVPVNAYEQANMEWFWLLMGRPELNSGPLPVAASDIADLFAGRFGEPERLFHVCTSANTLADFYRDAPKPGTARQDDNNDVLEGIPGYGVRGLTNPLDFVGSGRWVQAANPRFPIVRQVVEQTNSTATPVQVPQYLGYSVFTRTLNLVDMPLGPNQQHFPGEDGVFGTPDDLILPNGNFEFRNVLFDDINEGISEPEETDRPADEMFAEAETLAQHMTDADIQAAGDQVSQRLRNLAPYAFDRAEIRQRTTTSSWSLKEHSLSLPFPPGRLQPFGLDGKPGWAGVDDDGDMEVDEWDEIGTYDPNTHGRSEDGFRAWLFNADVALFDSDNNNILRPNNRYEFPPRYGRSVVFTTREINTGPLAARTEADGSVSEDPFRPQLRRLLRLEAGDGRQTFGQLPLNINRFLDIERKPNQAADLIRGTLEYRPLTEHLGARNADGTWANNVLAEQDITPCPYPPRDFNGDGSIVDEQEYWARRDRQKMARDIYVMLYTLGGGNDETNYTASNMTLTPPVSPTDPPTNVTYNFYTPAQLRQMAQLAVNIVDALDRDGISTRFEYDKNLGDTIDAVTGDVLRSGWNLDDNIGNATTNDGFIPFRDNDPRVDGLSGGYDGHYPEDSAERGVVYGVEKQELAFSEVLAVFAQEINADHAATLYDDDAGGHALLHIELQNLTTQDVELATPVTVDDAHAVYRIRRFNDDAATPANKENQGKLAFMVDAGVVDAAEVFTISTSAGNDIEATSNAHRPSCFYVDIDLDGRYERISPSTPISGTGLSFPTATSAPTDPELQPTTNLDLVHQRDRNGVNKFSINGAGVGTEGDFLTNGAAPVFDPTSVQVPMNAQVLVLERRANPHMPSLSLAENPWIEVDRKYAVFREFELQPGTNYNMDPVNPDLAPGLLATLHAERRNEPLRAVDPTPPGGMMPSPDTYTLGRVNTIGEPNWRGGVPFSLLQPHYDRDFTSLGELLHLPLYGPDSVTSQLYESQQGARRSGNNGTDQESAAGTVSGWPNVPGLDDTTAPTVVGYGRGRPRDQGLTSGANGKFLLPDFPDGTAHTDLVEADLDNRWYLMFGMLEVPTRTHRQLGNPLVNLDRVPGKINPNTIRHPQILAALLDDPLIADLDTTSAPFNTLSESGPADITPLPTPTGLPAWSETRNWWQQFVESRDGAFTPPNGGHTLIIPGLPGSKPFEAFGRMAGNAFSYTPGLTDNGTVGAQDIERTLLRTLPTDFTDGNRDGRDDNNAGRRLFEIGESADFDSETEMTPQSRHRILSKMLNNTTPSSNVFVVHMTIGYFEVTEDPVTGVVRIGGEYDIVPGDSQPASFNRKRSVFLIDRSEASRAYDAGSNTFDYRRLIKQEVTIQ